jgi:hypothetical protein
MPYDQDVKELAYTIDLPCWESYFILHDCDGMDQGRRVALPGKYLEPQYEGDQCTGRRAIEHGMCGFAIRSALLILSNGQQLGVHRRASRFRGGQRRALEGRRGLATCDGFRQIYSTWAGPPPAPQRGAITMNTRMMVLAVGVLATLATGGKALAVNCKLHGPEKECCADSFCDGQRLRVNISERDCKRKEKAAKSWHDKNSGVCVKF